MRSQIPFCPYCSPPAESVLSQRSIQVSRIMLLFALILVFGLYSAQVQGNPFRRQMDGDDWCSSGLGVFDRFMNCDMRFSGQRMFSSFNISLDNGILNTYCSQEMPEIRECFAREISSCDPATQRHLNQLANNTGFLCQPGGNQPLPQITFLLSEAGLGELSVSQVCRDVTPAKCARDAADALQIDEDTIEAASVDEIVRIAQSSMEMMGECLPRWFRENADKCPNWRKSAVVNFFNMFSPPYLGMTMPFTQDELEEMLQRIASCDPETRLELNNMVNKTGSLCQPGGTQPNAVVSFLLSHLDEETYMYLQSECPRLPLGDCYREAREIAAPSLDESTAMSLTLEETVSLLQTMSKLQSECFVRWFRERADSCPGWRRVSALILLSELDPQYLGLTFPFTKAEISEIFEVCITRRLSGIVWRHQGISGEASGQYGCCPV
ncbi:hypothetical protein BaRGS_00023006 [Batillaria attramentaria]|uniref:Uncharacterized protein n=1 Tax=Batillaria attramentaria TaxID=370345 RepID=A0ABD0KFF0_9CAEN